MDRVFYFYLCISKVLASLLLTALVGLYDIPMINYIGWHSSGHPGQPCIDILNDAALNTVMRVCVSVCGIILPFRDPRQFVIWRPYMPSHNSVTGNLFAPRVQSL